MTFTPSGEQSVEIQIEAEDNASQAFNNVEQSALNAKNAVGAAGGVLAGAGVASFANAADAAASFEDSMMDVQKVTDEQTADELADDIKDLATEVRLSHDEIAELATQAGRMGAEGSDEIAEFTETAAKMGAATTLSSDEAGKALGKMASALGEPIDNADELADSINELSNDFETDSSEIVDSAQRSGQALDTLGLQSDEILGLSAAFNEVSPSSRVAAQRMQQVGEAMMDPSNVEMFADILGVTADEFIEMRDEAPEETMMELMDSIDGNQDALNTLNDELTTSQARAFRDTASSTDEMREAMELSNEAMEEGGSVAKENAQDMDTFAGQMDALRSQVHNIYITMGEAFLPVLLELGEIVAPLIEGFATLNERFDGLPAVIVSATAAIGGLTVAITALTGVAATTILPIIAALGALAAIAYGVKKAWDENLFGIRDTLQTVFQDFVMPLVTRLRELWEEEFEAIAEDVVETMDVVSERIETVLTYLEAFWDDHGDEIMTIVETTFGFLELTIGTVMRAIATSIRVTLALIRLDFVEALSLIGDFWTTTFGDMWDFISGPWLEGIKATFSLFFGVIVDIFEKLYELLIGGSIVPDTFNEIKAFIAGALSDIVSNLRNFFTTLTTIWLDGFRRITDWLASAGRRAFERSFGAVADAITGVVDSMISYIRDGITGVTDWIIDAIGDTVEDAVSRFNRAVPDFLEIPSLTVGGGSLSIPSKTISNPAGSDWTIGGGSLGLPSETIGGLSLDLPQLASGGIITADTLARVGEAGQPEAVVPLHKLSQYLDTAYEVGAETVPSSSAGTTGGSSSALTATLRVEGDGELAELIRENAELVVEEREQSKQARIARM